MEHESPAKIGGDRPLAGMRVLDLTRGAMGAISRHYAELGADVIRIEPADGAEDRQEGRLVDGISLDFVAANLGKRAAPTDQLGRLAADADMIVAPRGAVDAAALRRINPALLIFQLSDFGDTGRFSRWRGSEAVFHALSGELSRSGLPGREPLLPPDDLSFASAAAQAAYLGLIAYWHRLRTGAGDLLDFSVLDGAGQALDPGYGIGGSATQGVPAALLPRDRPDVGFMYPILPCRDGHVRLCVLAPRQWQGMVEWMGRPEEFADPSFNRLQTRFASKSLLAAMKRHLAGKTRAEVERESQQFGVPAAAVLDVTEVLEAEHIKARRAFASVEIAPDVQAPFPDGVLEVDGIRMSAAGPAPALPIAVAEWRPRSDPVLAPAGAAKRPLDGIRVLDFGVIVVGAESGRLLGDQGADVIKVESTTFPDGARQSLTPGPISAGFAAGQRNKRSLGLNLRAPGGRELLERLVRDTDVILTNFKGGTLESLGLDYATLQAINPRVIVCDSSAYGTSGPDSRRMGYGPLVRAGYGLTMQWRYPEPDGFCDAMTVYPDHVAARVGMIGVLALLIRRERTGRGGQLSLSQGEVILSHMAAGIAARALTDAGWTVVDTREASVVHRCAGDDEWCAVTVRGLHDRAAIAKVTGARPLEDWLAERSPHEAMEALQAAGVAAGAMLRVSELPAFDYYAAREAFREVRHPHIEEPLIVEAGLIGSEQLPETREEPAPLACEHSIEIVVERLGLGAEEIGRLIASGALEQLERPS